MEVQAARRAEALNGLDPYVRDVIGHVAEHPINRADELLPWNVAQQWTNQQRERQAGSRRGAAVIADP